MLWTRGLRGVGDDALSARVFAPDPSLFARLCSADWRSVTSRERGLGAHGANGKLAFEWRSRKSMMTWVLSSPAIPM